MAVEVFTRRMNVAGLFRAMSAVRALVFAGAMAAAVFASTDAQAQSAVCRQISSELASIGRGGGGGSAALRQAAGLRRQYGRVQQAMAQLGCNRGGFFTQVPQQCGGLKQQASALAGSINQLEGSARQASGGAQRRAQLNAMYEANNCRNGGRAEVARAPAQQRIDPQPAQRPRGFFETLFGIQQAAPAAGAAPQYATTPDPTLRSRDPDEEDRRKKRDAERSDGEGRRVGGGRMPICVRTCDGYFFPVNYQGAEDQYAELCRASCPGATAEMYWMSAGADLDTAVSGRGAPYSALPTAFQYRQARDPACTCKPQGESWGTALQQAEALIRRRGDMVVTDESSQRMSQPVAKELRGIKPTTEAPPTTGNAPKISRVSEETREVEHDGETKTIRVVSPQRTIAQ